MKQRLLTGLMIVATIILVLMARQLSTYIFDVFVLILSFMAAYEMSNILAKMNFYNNKYFIWCYPFIAYGIYILGINISMEWYMIILLELLAIILLFAILGLISLIMQKNTKNEIATRNLKLNVGRFTMFKTTHTMLGFLYPSLLMLFLVAINNLGNMSYLFEMDVKDLANISLFGLVITFTIPIFADTFAYLTGMLFKGPKLCPKISPNKTISGAIGGALWGTIGAVIMFLIFNAIPSFNEAFAFAGFQFWHFIILGLIASILCECGDLFESYLKRKAGLKDAGDILPGHGGILDRMDSHLFCAPVVFIFLIILL